MRAPFESVGVFPWGQGGHAEGVHFPTFTARGEATHEVVTTIGSSTWSTPDPSVAFRMTSTKSSAWRSMGVPPKDG
ncbi:MAG: hypothetical protein CM15mP18_1920 [Methanobacteriota archaeon]|nr:MAG: hypothetical protein CM15mP18_1920 [Euryarchaeota archaeon]